MEKSAMKIMLTPELKALIDRKVASGLYQSASEVVREALRALKDRDRMRELRLRIASGYRSGHRGFQRGAVMPNG
jgi:antitoxin ParD1/3/4